MSDEPSGGSGVGCSALLGEHDAKQARPHRELIAELMDSRVPKTEREHAAAREVERLRQMLRDECETEYEELTDEECLTFRMMPGSFNDMVRSIHKHGWDGALLFMPPNAQAQPTQAAGLGSGAAQCWAKPQEKQGGFAALELTVGAGIVAVLALLIWAMVVSEKEWQAFASTHNCKVVEKVAATTSTGYGYGMQINGKYGYGMITTTRPSKTAYDCNDGVRYWR